MKQLSIKRISEITASGIPLFESPAEDISFENLLNVEELQTTLLKIGGKQYFVQVLEILSLKNSFNELADDEIIEHLNKMAAWQYTLITALSDIRYDLKIEKLDYESWRANIGEQLRNTLGEKRPSNDRIHALIKNKYPDITKMKLEKIYKLESLVDTTASIFEILKLRNETLRSILRSRDLKKGKGSGVGI